MGRGRYEIALGFYTQLSDISQRNGETKVSGSTETLVDEAHSCGLLSGISSLVFLALSSSCYLVVELCTLILLLCGSETAIRSRRWMVGRLSDSCPEGDVRSMTIFVNLLYIYTGSPRVV